MRREIGGVGEWGSGGGGEGGGVEVRKKWESHLRACSSTVDKVVIGVGDPESWSCAAERVGQEKKRENSLFTEFQTNSWTGVEEECAKSVRSASKSFPLHLG